MSIKSLLSCNKSALVQRAANFVGLEIRHYPGSSVVWRFADRARLAADTSRPIVVLDVGANEGQFAREVRSHGFEGPLVSFEPLTAPFSVLSKLSDRDQIWTCYQVALGAERGQASINVASNHGASSSILKPLEAHKLAAPSVSFSQTETVSLCRLDDFDLATTYPESDFALKADVQGYEIEVLKGAEELLATGKVKFIQLEMSIRPVYESSPSALQLLGFMDDRGFDLIDIGGEFRDGGSRELIQVDAVFQRREAVDAKSTSPIST